MYLCASNEGKTSTSRKCLLAVLSASLLLASPAMAGYRFGSGGYVPRKPTPTPAPAYQTWIANPVSSDWNTAANWTPATAPNSTSAKAVFGTSSVNAGNSIITFSSPVTTVSDLTFNAGASPYIFQATGTQSLVFTGSGITNNSSQPQLFLTTGILQDNPSEFFIRPDTTQSNVTFKNNATSGSASLGGLGSFYFQDNASAGTSTISLIKFVDGKPVTEAPSTGGDLYIFNAEAGPKLIFSDHATAAQSNIYGDFSYLANPYVVAPMILFHDYATAGASSISGRAYLEFDSHATAGTSTIDLSEGLISFSENATAGNAVISNGPSDGPNHFIYQGSSDEVLLTFFDNATAGSAFINLQRSDVVFFENSTASTSSINKFGSLTFTDNANAGNSTIGSVTAATNSPTSYFGYVTPSIYFEKNAKAGTAQIYLRDANRMVFSDNASADHAKILIDGMNDCVNHCGYVAHPSITAADFDFVVTNTTDATPVLSGTIDVEFGGTLTPPLTTYLAFKGASSADHAAIDLKAGGAVYFQDNSTASAATITADGSLIAFQGHASGGTASIVNNEGAFDMGNMLGDLTVGSIAGSGFFYLGDKKLTTGGNNSSTVVSGDIYDDNFHSPSGGSLTKVGTGSMTLNGHNSYVGRTTVSGGSLIIGDQSHNRAVITSDAYVSASATLSGYGTIDGNLTATGGATIRPGGTSGTFGTLHVMGDYTQSATDTLEIQLSPTGYSQLMIDGSASLNGNLYLNAANGSYGVGQVYNILTASSLSGSFSSVSSTAGTSFKVNYNPADNLNGVDAVYLGSTTPTTPPKRGPGKKGRNTTNGTSVFYALGFAAEGSATDPLFFAASRVGGFEIYDSLGGEVQADAMMSMAHGHWSFLDRLSGNDDVITGNGSLSLLGFTDGQAVQGDETTSWSAHFDDTDSLVSHDSNFSESGDMSGAVFNLGQGRQVGFASSHSTSKLEMSEGQQSGKFDAVRLGGFASKTLHGLVADVVIGGSYMTLTSERGIGLVGANASGTTQASAVGGETGLSYPLQFGDFAVNPHIGFGYMQMRQDAYSETGAGLANLQIDAVDMTLMRSTMDVSIGNKTVLGSEHSLVSMLSIGWEHQFRDVVPELRERFAETPDAEFIIAGADKARDALHLGAAMQTDMTAGVMLFAKGDVSATADQTDQVIKLGLQVRF